MVPTVDWPLEGYADEKKERHICIPTELVSPLVTRTVRLARLGIPTSDSRTVAAGWNKRRQPLTRHSLNVGSAMDGCPTRLVSQHTRRIESALFKLKVCPTGWPMRVGSWDGQGRPVQTSYLGRPLTALDLNIAPPLHLQHEAQPGVLIDMHLVGSGVETLAWFLFIYGS